METRSDTENTDKDEILKAYKDPKIGLVGLNDFIKRMKLQGYSKDKVKEAINNEDAYVLNKPSQNKFTRRTIVLNHKNETWCADLADVSNEEKENNGTRFLLIVIDGMSKFAWVKPLKTKKPEDVKKSLNEIITSSKQKPINLWTDDGLEFTAKIMKDYYEKQGINWYSTATSGKAIFAERFIRTLRMRLSRLADSRGNHKYIDVLQDIVANYNNTVHSTTKIKPALFKESDEEIARQRMAALAKNKDSSATSGTKEETVRKPKFKPGDYVRMQNTRGVFQKESNTERWSRQIFKVKSYELTSPITYGLEDLKGEEVKGKLYEKELMKTIYDPNANFAYEIVKDKNGKPITEMRKEGRKNIRFVLVRWLGYPDKFNEYKKESELKK